MTTTMMMMMVSIMIRPRRVQLKLTGVNNLENFEAMGMSFAYFVLSVHDEPHVMFFSHVSLVLKSWLVVSNTF